MIKRNVLFLTDAELRHLKKTLIDWEESSLPFGLRTSSIHRKVKEKTGDCNALSEANIQCIELCVGNSMHSDEDGISLLGSSQLVSSCRKAWSKMYDAFFSIRG